MGSPSSRPASIRRPLATATAALRGAASGRARHGAAFLAELLDFEGAVLLAHALETPAPVATSAWSAADAVARAGRRLAIGEHDARQPLREPHTGAPLATAERIELVLERTGAAALRQRKPIAIAAREIFMPIEARAVRKIDSLRRLVAEIRQELGPVIAARGPSAARIEHLDAALKAATATRSDALFSRAVGALGEAFAAELERELLALPRPCGEIPAAAWAGEGGLVAVHVARCEELVVAAFLHERARLDMLVRNTLGERLG